MRLIMFFLVAGAILSVAKALTPILILLVIALVLWALIQRPAELFGLLLLGLLTGALQARPTTTILCVAGIAGLIALKDSAPEKPTMDSKTG